MSSPQTALVIRDIQDQSELLQVEQLQKDVWGVEDREVLPALAMIPMKEVGGILLGAFDDARLIGFSFAFPGFENGHPILHSDMLAVLPAYRSLGLGLQLKLAQRKQALEKGIDTITWTFDPLQSVNANLNFGKLGVVSDLYLVNYYGETTSFLHSTGTDRLWVTWKLDSEWVRDRIEQWPGSNENAEENSPNIVGIGAEDEPIESPSTDASKLFLDIPTDYNRLVKERNELAVSWRVTTRKAFLHALNAGYFIQDFWLVKAQDRTFGRYLLITQRATAQ